MTKSRIFLFLLLSFIAGIAVRSFLPVPYFLMWLGLVGSLAVSSTGIFRRQKVIVVYGFLVVAFLAGIFRFDQVEQSRPDLSLFYGKAQEMAGIVVEDPERTEKVERLTLKVSAVDSRDVMPFLALVTLRKYPEYHLGDELRVRGILERPENFSDFDYISYLSRQDIYSTVSFPIIERVGEGKGSKLKLWLSGIKHSFEAKIDRVLNEPHAAFLKGLLLGERSSLPPDLVENFKLTGTSHIVALSGYNITMVGRFFTAGLLLLTVPFQFSFWLAIFGIGLFVLMTGASASVVRAGIMGILVLVARREGRIYHMTNALALAGAAMIFQNPRILRFDAAFQLSFLATLGLVYLSPRVELWLDKVSSRMALARGKILLKKDPLAERSKLFPFRRILIETLSAQLMVLPLLIYLFGRVSIISPITNILVLIAVPYAMATGFATGIAGFWWEPLSRLLGWITWVLLEYQIRIIEFFAKVPAASIKFEKWMAVLVFTVYLTIFWRLWRRSRRTQN
ncbi:MAG: ComEC family competence protein [Candidatus Sungbacteria bacterium]|nr:ComEC family competence protein [Candidatus Sungbacteria bacterium]